MKRASLAAIVLALIGIWPAEGVAGQRVQVPGTGLSLEPPEGFTPSERFPGFQRTDVRAAILVSEFAAPTAEMLKGMSSPSESLYAAKGMKRISWRAMKISGLDALLVKAGQTRNGLDSITWILVTGDESTAVMVTAAYPKAFEENLEAGILTALLGASWTRTGPKDPFEGLAFRVTPTPLLKIAGPMGNGLALTESGKLSGGPTNPVFFVAPSLTPVKVKDLSFFAMTRAAKIEQIREIENVSGREITVGGLPAYELLADAKDAKTGDSLRVYEVIATEEGGYIMFLGLVPAARGNELLPEFRRVTESYRKKADSAKGGPEIR